MQEGPLRIPVEQKGEDIFSALPVLYVEHLKQLCLVPVSLQAIRLSSLNMKKLSGCRRTQGVVISGFFKKPCAIDFTQTNAREPIS